MKEYNITINNRSHNVIVKKIQSDLAIVEVNGTDYEVEIEKKIRRHLEPLDVKPTLQTGSRTTAVQEQVPAEKVTASTNQIVAPLPGLIMNVLVKVGDKIKANQIVLKMEAMKMENDVKSDQDGIVEEIHVKSGDSVLENSPLITLGNK